LIRALSADDLLSIGRAQLGDHVSARDGSLDAVVLELSRRHQGREVYPGVHVKAAALLMALLRTRPFGGGDAAVALLSTVVFLNLNGLQVRGADEDMVALVAVAASGDADVLQIAGAIEGLTAGLLADVD
jgi:death-on-curing protein